jgi:hypothetical protein
MNQKKVIHVKIFIFEKNKNKNKIIILVSGDSWEREFDETDLISSSIPLKSDENLSTEPEQTTTSESLPSSTTTAAAPVEESLPSTSSKRKPENEFDDEWDAWA